MRKYTGLLLALTVATSSWAADAKKTVAIADFTSTNAPAGESVALSQLVRSAVVRSNAFIVVDKKNMDSLLAEQAFQQTGCTSQECAVKLGKILNVQKMVVGDYTLMGNVRYLMVQLVDVESGQIEKSTTEKGFGPGEADTVANRIASRLTETRVAEEAALPPAAADRETGGANKPYEKWWITAGAGFSLANGKVTADISKVTDGAGNALSFAQKTPQMQYKRIAPTVMAGFRAPITDDKRMGVGCEFSAGSFQMSEPISEPSIGANPETVSIIPGDVSFGSGAALVYYNTGKFNILGGLEYSHMAIGFNKSTVKTATGERSMADAKTTIDSFNVRAGAEYMINNRFSVEGNLIIAAGAPKGESTSKGGYSVTVEMEDIVLRLLARVNF